MAGDEVNQPIHQVLSDYALLEVAECEDMHLPLDQPSSLRMNLCAISLLYPTKYFIAVNSKICVYGISSSLVFTPQPIMVLKPSAFPDFMINGIKLAPMRFTSGGPTDEVLVAVGDNGEIFAWNTRTLFASTTPSTRPFFHRHNGGDDDDADTDDSSTWGIALHVDGLIAVSANNHRITIYNLWTALSQPRQNQLGTRYKVTLAGHTHNIPCIDFDTSGRYMASGSIDMTCRLWDLATLKQVGKRFMTRTQDSDAWLWGVKFIPTGDFKSVTCNNGMVTKRFERQVQQGRSTSTIDLYLKHSAGAPIYPLDMHQMFHRLQTGDLTDDDEDGDPAVLHHLIRLRTLISQRLGRATSPVTAAAESLEDNAISPTTAFFQQQQQDDEADAGLLDWEDAIHDHDNEEEEDDDDGGADDQYDSWDYDSGGGGGGDNAMFWPQDQGDDHSMDDDEVDDDHMEHLLDWRMHGDLPTDDDDDDDDDYGTPRDDDSSLGRRLSRYLDGDDDDLDHGDGAMDADRFLESSSTTQNNSNNNNNDNYTAITQGDWSTPADDDDNNDHDHGNHPWDVEWNSNQRENYDDLLAEEEGWMQDSTQFPWHWAGVRSSGSHRDQGQQVTSLLQDDDTTDKAIDTTSAITSTTILEPKVLAPNTATTTITTTTITTGNNISIPYIFEPTKSQTSKAPMMDYLMLTSKKDAYLLHPTATSDEDRWTMAAVQRERDVVHRADVRTAFVLDMMERLSFVEWIPELELCVMASQKGCVALTRILQVQWPHSNEQSCLLNHEQYLPLHGLQNSVLYGMTVHRLPADDQQGTAAAAPIYQLLLLYLDGTMRSYRLSKPSHTSIVDLVSVL